MHRVDEDARKPLVTTGAQLLECQHRQNKVHVVQVRICARFTNTMDSDSSTQMITNGDRPKHRACWNSFEISNQVINVVTSLDLTPHSEGASVLLLSFEAFWS